MILFARSMIKFEEETNNFVRSVRKPIIQFSIMRNSLKAVFVKPRFIMRVFIVKNEGTEKSV